MKQSWSEPAIKGPPPTPRDSHSCTVIGDSLFVFGGTDGSKLLNDLHILDTCAEINILDSHQGVFKSHICCRSYIHQGVFKSHNC